METMASRQTVEANIGMVSIYGGLPQGLINCWHSQVPLSIADDQEKQIPLARFAPFVLLGRAISYTRTYSATPSDIISVVPVGTLLYY